MRKTSRPIASGVALLAVCLLVAAGPQASSSQEKAAAMEALLTRYYEYGLFNGAVLVAEQGRVIYENGFGMANFEWNIPNEPGTKFRLASITKQFTAAIVLQLIEEGKLRLGGHISDYLPEYPKETGSRITLHQLLVHTSGIPDYTQLPHFVPQVSQRPHTPEALLGEFRTLDLEFEPGSRFRYNNSDYVILGAVIERVTKKPYEKVVEERIFKPLGMTNSGYDHHETIIAKRASGYYRTFDGYQNAAYLDMSVPYAAGSLYSTVDDLFLWDQALYRHALMSADSMGLMLKPNERNYGYGFFVWEERIVPIWKLVKIAAHSGHIDGFDTMIQRFLDDRHLIVLLNNTGQTNLTEIADNLKRILYGAEPHEPRKPVAELLHAMVKTEGVAAAVARYRALKAAGSIEYDLSPAQLERLGRHLLDSKRSSDAIAVMELNAEVNWNNGWVYASLGDAYREAGDLELALSNYRRAMNLDPQNSVLAAKVKALID